MNVLRYDSLVLVLALVLASAPACTDHSYDFERLDREITVGGDITLPLGSTGRITVAFDDDMLLWHRI